MNIADYCSTFVDKIVIKCEETTDQFIFQVIHNWALNSCQIEVDKQELIDAIQLIRKSRGADIIFKDPGIIDKVLLDTEVKSISTLNNDGIKIQLKTKGEQKC